MTFVPQIIRPLALCLFLLAGIQGQALLAQNFNREVELKGEAFFEVEIRQRATAG